MKILVICPISSHAIEELQKIHDVVISFNPDTNTLNNLIKDREILIFRSGVDVSAELMEKAPALKFLVRAGSGTDNIDLEYAINHGIRLERFPGPGAQAVAEMTLTLMFALSRNLLVADQSMREGRWEKYNLPGLLIRGKTLGVIGPGNIGLQVGILGQAVGMEVIACDEIYTPELAERLAKHDIRQVKLTELLETSDYVCLHVPLMDSTRNLINADALSKMKPSAFLVNMARGGIVDEKVLYDALTKEDGIRGAALDVHEQEGEGKLSPLANLPNVILTPHIGAMTTDSQYEIGAQILEKITLFAEEIENVK